MGTRPLLPVLVTGASGFVGGHLARALARTGRVVVATDMPTALPEWVTRGLSDPARVRYVSSDLTGADALAQLLGAIAAASDEAGADRYDVAHVAALTRFHGEVALSPDDLLLALAINVEVPWRLCAALARDDRLGRLVHVSTRSVFGRRPPGLGPITEDSAYVPVRAYGHSKAAGELGVLTAVEEFGIDAVVARITGVFGPWQGPRSPVAQVLDAASRGHHQRLDVGADHSLEITYVKDTVSGLAALLDAPVLEHLVYHVSSGSMWTIADVVAAASAVAPDLPVELPQDAPAQHKRTGLDITRIGASVGWHPAWDLESAMADAVEAERTETYGVEVADAASRG